MLSAAASQMFEALSKGFRSARDKLNGVVTLTEENLDVALKEVRVSLLEADVELGVAKQLLARVKERSLGEKVDAGEAKKRGFHIGPAEQFIRICQEELEGLMAFEGPPIAYGDRNQVTGIMMVGLQGSGKTTSSAKLARWLEKEEGRKVLLVAADTQRPGAVEQLQTLGAAIDIPVFAIPGGRPTDICEKALAEAKKRKRNTIIFDTAGRLAIDAPLMEELGEIQRRVTPQNVLLVVDAMVGQDSVRTAKGFHEQLGLTGVVLTKLDGDARGGAALSIKEVTGAPVKFVGMGEGTDKLEPLRADGLASRILGFGDVVGLVKDFEGVVDEKKAEADAKKMLQGQFTLDDFLEQISMMQQMGSMQDLMEKLPFFADSVPQGFQFDDRELVRTKAMVHSMTPAERNDIQLFKRHPRRLDRVAKGSGSSKKAVAELLQRFAMMKNMLGGIGQQAGKLSKIPGLKQLASANRLREAIRTGGMEGNPMMANLAEELLQAAVVEQGGAPKAPSTRQIAVSKAKKKNLRKMQRKSRQKRRK